MASETQPRSGRSPLPVVVAGATLVVALLRRRRRGAAKAPPPKPSEWLTAHTEAQYTAVQGKDVAHAGSGAACPSAAPAAPAPPAPRRSPLAARAAALAALSTAAVAAVVALLCMRGAPDLAVAVALAWALNLLQLKAPRVNGVPAVKGAPEALAPVAPPQPRVPLPPIAGTWVKDHRASDSMEPIMEAMRMNGLLRGAVRLLRGLEIKLDESTFSFAVFSVVKWFKVAETYPMDGGVSTSRRRDLRGKMRGAVRVTAHGSLLVVYEWDAPLAGRGEDEFVVSDGRLRVMTTNWVGGREVKYTQVYVRR